MHYASTFRLLLLIFCASLLVASTWFVSTVNQRQSRSKPALDRVALPPSFPPRPRFPLKASSNRRYFLTQDDVPFLLVGDAPQSLIGRLTESRAATYFADRRAHGFNAAWINLLCNALTGCNANGATNDGLRPFLRGDSTETYDLSSPSPDYFARADAMVRLAAQNDIVVLLDPIETSGWLKTLENNGLEKAFNYGVYVGNRYRSFPNLLWLSGNDFQTWRTNPMHNSLVRQVMAGIASADTQHLQSVELDFLRSYSSQDQALAPLIGYNGVYTYYETYDYVLKAYDSVAMPVVMLEANYEFEHNGNTDGGSLSNLRRQEYWTLLSGAAGQLYGSRYTWTSTWGDRSALDTRGTTELEFVSGLFLARPWWGLVPDNRHELVIGGYGSYREYSTTLNTADYCTTAWVPDGSLAITYCPRSTTLKVRMDKMQGATTARWYDPTSGEYQTVEGAPFPNQSVQSFVTPGLNSGGARDWALVLTSE